MLSEDEGKFLFEKGCDQVVIGSGQMCNVHLSPEAEAYFERKGCEVLLKPTPEAIRNRARLRKRTVSAFNIIATNEFTVADNGRLTSSATVAAASGLIVSVCPIGRNTGAGR